MTVDDHREGVRDDPAAAGGQRPSTSVLALISASAVPTAITRAADGTILFANDACLEMLGWDEREFVGRTMSEVGFWARPERRARMVERLAADGFVRELEEEVKTRTGEVLIVLASISPVEIDGEPCLIGHIHDITERRRLEQELRESRERFRQVTETFQQGFLLREVDPPAVLYASPAVARIFGVDLDVLYADALALQRLIHPQDLPAVTARRNAMAGATDFEFRIVRADGQTRWIRTRAEPVPTEPGQAARIAAVSEDVTVERGLREALRDSEERFRLIVEGVQDYAIFMLDVDGNVNTWNAGARRIKGYEAGEIVGRHFSAFYPAADVAAGKPARELALAQARGRVEDEGWRIRKDGTQFWANVLITAVWDGDGTLRGYAKITRDLTKRRAAEVELRDSEARFRLLAENSTDVIGRLAPDLRILYVSPACRSVYGHEPEAMVGRHGWDFIHPDDLAAMRADFSAAAEPRDVVTNTYRVLRGDGDHVWVEATIHAIRDPQTGDVVEFHTVARDVGDRVRAEADIRRARDEAERANAAKSDFLSRMSHELRTPLHAILGFSDLVSRAGVSETQRRHLSHITRGGNHLLDLINEILDLSRIERGELGISLEAVHLGKVVHEALDLIVPLAAARTVTIRPFAAEDAEVHVRADRQRLKQVLLNILSNAVKYNREGGEITVTSSCAGSPTARIEITDTGSGIGEDDLGRVFAAFERLGAETTDVEGPGLGLTMRKGLIGALGGQIGVESTVGRGSRFWFELPIVAATALPARSDDHGVAAASPRTRVARTVLYIEDNPSNIMLAEAILAARPEVTLLVATQGGLGLELAREHQPALILLDLNLPDMSGAEVLRRIRGGVRGADVAVVMLSADATPKQIARLRRAGADEYLTKPFGADELLAAVDRFAESRGSSQEPYAAGSGEDDAAAAGPSAPAAASAGTPPELGGALDPARMAGLRRICPDADALRDLVTIFLQDSRERLPMLAAAVAEGDAEAVRQAAHAWRGACSIVGAHRVGAQLADIEVLARVGAIPDEETIAAVAAAYTHAEQALTREIR